MLSEDEIEDLRTLKEAFKKVFKEKYNNLSESEKNDLLTGK